MVVVVGWLVAVLSINLHYSKCIDHSSGAAVGRRREGDGAIAEHNGGKYFTNI